LPRRRQRREAVVTLREAHARSPVKRDSRRAAQAAERKGQGAILPPLSALRSPRLCGVLLIAGVACVPPPRMCAQESDCGPQASMGAGGGDCAPRPWGARGRRAARGAPPAIDTARRLLFVPADVGVVRRGEDARDEAVATLGRANEPTVAFLRFDATVPPEA